MSRRGQFSDHYCSLFIPLASLLKHHGISYHIYAGDTQLFQEFSLSDSTSPEIAIRKMELCVAGILQWMSTNILKLNYDKTEILIIHPKSAQQPKVQERSLHSFDMLLLKQPTFRNKIDQRSLSCAAPRACNQLPLTVRQYYEC